MQIGEIIRTLFGAFIFVVGYMWIILKKLKDIKNFQMSSDDETIEGEIVDNKPFLFTGDVHPVALCLMNGIELKYEYRYFYSESQFPIGKKVELKISRASGLPYVRKDLIKDIILHLFFMIFFIIGICGGLYVLIYLR